jgi:hypothetical protein
MTPRTFDARMSYRPRALLAGVALVLGAFVVGGLLMTTLGRRAEHVVPWLATAAALGFFAATVISVLPRAVRITLDGDMVSASWRRPIPLHECRFELGRLVLGGIDTPCGMALHIIGRGKPLSIGVLEHAGEGYAIVAAPVRQVDCHVSLAQFDALLAAFGIHRGAPSRELVVELTRSSQTIGGVFGMMLPWFATIGAAGMFGVIVGTTGIGDRLQRMPYGPAALGAMTLAIVLSGLVITVMRQQRVRLPELELRATDGGVELHRVDGPLVARAPWSAVRATPRTYRLSTRSGGSYAFPVLDLSIGDGAAPLLFGAWDTSLAWPFDAKAEFWSPRFLAGSAPWRKLVAELQTRGLLVRT